MANDPNPLGPPSPPPDTYISSEASLKYWNSVPSTVNGMLGGYAQISCIDLKGSANFLAKLRREHPFPALPAEGPTRGLDCGAGIGRVTAGFLSKVCDVIDIVEPVQKFADEIKTAKMEGKGEVGRIYVSGLQDWRGPEEGVKYDLIWHQWCLGHLTDKQSVEYFQRCKEYLREGGWIVVKENISTSPMYEDLFDETDSSVTKTHKKYLRLFEEAGCVVKKTEVQRGLPASLKLYPIKFYALRALS